MIDFDLKVRSFPFTAHCQPEIEAWREGSMEYGKNWPVVYFIHDEQKKEGYIGETLNAGKRADQHWQQHPERQRLTTIHLVTDKTFNKSAISMFAIQH